MSAALITGITGQDGAYLAKLLLQKNYQVTGTTRIASHTHSPALAALGIERHVRLLPVDFSDTRSLARAVEQAAPDEIYNLAAQSSVAQSFREPTYTGDVTGLGVARLLQAVREAKPEARFYQASSSEMYGQVRETPQRESTPFYPRSPYGAAKVYAHWMTVNYRESYGMFACNGILFNHESPLRPEQFVTRKVTGTVARIKHGLADSLTLGNLDVERDWGFAGDYVEAMWRMLQQETADDFIIATGKTHSLREFVECAFAHVGLDYREYVRVDPAFFRPAEVNTVVGDSSKAERELGWTPCMSFEELVGFLMEAELRRVAGDAAGIQYCPE